MRKKDFRLLGNKIGFNKLCVNMLKSIEERNVCRGKSSNMFRLMMRPEQVDLRRKRGDSVGGEVEQAEGVK